MTIQTGDVNPVSNQITPIMTPETSDSLLATHTLQSLFEAGGPVIMILAIMSLLATTIFFLKCWQFFWQGMSRHKNISAALKYWHTQQLNAALSSLKQTRNPIARVLETAMSLKAEPRKALSPETQLANDALAREEVMRIAKRELANARSHLKILEVIATLSPLLGLLGTVLGMITAFQKLQGAGSTIDPALLSGGIWEALLTTAAGLVVAIPTVIGLNCLEQRIERFKLVMEDTITQVFTSDLHNISSDGTEAHSRFNKTPNKQTSPLSAIQRESDIAVAT